MGLDPIAVLAAVGTILTTVVGAGIRRVWVWGWQLADMTKDRDFWREVALASMGDVAAVARKKRPDA